MLVCNTWVLSDTLENLNVGKSRMAILRLGYSIPCLFSKFHQSEKDLIKIPPTTNERDWVVRADILPITLFPQ